MDETCELIDCSRRLEEKSQELEAATKELRAANERLTELDKLKDDFVTTASHELRTPLTSIRAFSEIVHDNPDLTTEERRKFIQIIVQESERLTRSLNDILAKMEAGKIEWHMTDMHRSCHQVTVPTPRPRMTEQRAAAR
jgi:signal transduction histidine kinase